MRRVAGPEAGSQGGGVGGGANNDAEEVAALIARLHGRAAGERSRAEQALAALGPRAVPALAAFYGRESRAFWGRVRGSLWLYLAVCVPPLAALPAYVNGTRWLGNLLFLSSLPVLLLTAWIVSRQRRYPAALRAAVRLLVRPEASGAGVSSSPGVESLPALLAIYCEAGGPVVHHGDNLSAWDCPPEGAAAKRRCVALLGELTRMPAGDAAAALRRGHWHEEPCGHALGHLRLIAHGGQRGMQGAATEPFKFDLPARRAALCALVHLGDEWGTTLARTLAGGAGAESVAGAVVGAVAEEEETVLAMRHAARECLEKAERAERADRAAQAEAAAAAPTGDEKWWAAPPRPSRSPGAQAGAEDAALPLKTGRGA